MFYPQGMSQKRELEFASRALTSQERLKDEFKSAEFKAFAAWAHADAKRGDVFFCCISGAKVRNPGAVQPLLRHLGRGGARQRGLTAATR